MAKSMHNANIHVKHEYLQGGLVPTGQLAHTDQMNIANLRRMRGLNQTEFAELAGISQALVSRAENGEDGVTLRQFKAIAEALRVPLSDLFEEDRTKTENELMDLFRRLPKDRQQVWLEMSKTFARGLPEPTAEIS